MKVKGDIYIRYGYVVDQGEKYLIHPYDFHSNPETGDVDDLICSHYPSFTLKKELEGQEYELWQDDLHEGLIRIWEENFPGI